VSRTTVDRAELEEAKEGLPPRLQRFMDNFFLTCEPYAPRDNYLNYLDDIHIYGADGERGREYREHADQLAAAFPTITGYKPDILMFPDRGRYGQDLTPLLKVSMEVVRRHKGDPDAA
jgi:hypothetical protein